MKKSLLAFLILCQFRLDAQDLPLPRLVERENGPRLMTGTDPFLMLAGELHNSTTGSALHMRSVWSRLSGQNLNTVLAPVTWELLEPEEGHWDFSQIDSMIAGARQEGLKLVLLWFGSWKNGRSTYAPAWVKQDPQRFPLARDKNGNFMNTLSTFGEETMRADARAFTELLAHLRKTDQEEQTVIMIQIENEVGLLDYAAGFSGAPNTCMRDFSPKAEKAYHDPVPAPLIAYLTEHKNELHPALYKAWSEQGFPSTGTWEEVFGPGKLPEGSDWKNEFPYLTEELFMAWQYARYMGAIAKAGKEIHPLPFYVNAWLKKGNQSEPGLYPSGGPQAHLVDVYRAAAPDIDFIAPDIYSVEDFDWFCQTYTRNGNPLFIPETTVDPNGASRAFLAFGKYHALGYAPFGIDGGGLLNSAHPSDDSFQKVYGCLRTLEEYLLELQGSDHLMGLFIDGDKNRDETDMGTYTVSLERPAYLTAMGLLGTEYKGPEPAEELGTGAVVIQLEENQFLVAAGVGAGLIRIRGNAHHPFGRTDYLSVDEVRTDDAGTIHLHRLNGDETAFGGPVVRPGEAKVFLLKLYGYEAKE